MKRICVYCGSNAGVRPVYANAARELGTGLAERGIGLVYGGGNVGLMGILSDAVLAGGGQVIGVIPEELRMRELAHNGVTELRVVKTMHERKATMEELSDAFIALPGGFGTLEEFSEIATWALLGIHAKACGLLNIDGFYDGLLTFLDHAVAEGFIHRQQRSVIVSASDVDRMFDTILQTPVPSFQQWVRREHT
jgi:uncharacterized protein (TIGR00730 family)